jgi:hypothetical protein
MIEKALDLLAPHIVCDEKAVHLRASTAGREEGLG